MHSSASPSAMVVYNHWTRMVEMEVFYRVKGHFPYSVWLIGPPLSAALHMLNQ